MSYNLVKDYNENTFAGRAEDFISFANVYRYFIRLRARLNPVYTI